MAKLTFKSGSQPHTIYKLLSEGGSLTHEEAVIHKINRLAQRISDMKKKFEEAGVPSPVMVISERTKSGILISRYFFRGYGNSLENNSNAKNY